MMSSTLTIEKMQQIIDSIKPANITWQVKHGSFFNVVPSDTAFLITTDHDDVLVVLDKDQTLVVFARRPLQ